jgi:hypothetical protein
MARGDIVLFNAFAYDYGNKIHDFDSDTFKLGIVDDTITPAADDTTPTWADYSDNEVSNAGGYTTGGETLTGVTATETGGVLTFDSNNVTLAQNAAGFTDGYWGILYNSTAAGKNAFAYVDLGGPVSEAAGPIACNWNVLGIFTTKVNPS